MAAGIDQPPLLALVEGHLATRADLRGALNMRAVLRVAVGVVGHQPSNRTQIWKTKWKKLCVKIYGQKCESVQGQVIGRRFFYRVRNHVGTEKSRWVVSLKKWRKNRDEREGKG